MSRCARSVSSTRKSMLPRELVKEFSGGTCASGLHVLKTFPNTFNGFGVVLLFPIQVLGQGLVEGPGRVLAPATSELFELSQSLR
jgi:hypothetical protein